MKRLIALVPAALVVLAGCGDTCTSSPVAVSDVSGQCSSLSAGVPATINVRVCPKCTDTAASCRGEVVTAGGQQQIQLDPVVQQCKEQSGCATPGCAVQPVPCTIDKPLVAGTTYTVVYTTSSGDLATSSLTAGGSSATCSL